MAHSSPTPSAAQQQINHPPLAGAASLERWQQRATVLSQRQLQAPSRYDFVGGASSKAQFPFDQWRSCLNYALRRSQRHPERQFPAQGLPELREAIAHHIAYSRGVHCSAADLLVCNGAQQALDLIARVLVEPGCQVAMEDPGYPPKTAIVPGPGCTPAIGAGG